MTKSREPTITILLFHFTIAASGTRTASVSHEYTKTEKEYYRERK